MCASHTIPHAYMLLLRSRFTLQKSPKLGLAVAHRVGVGFLEGRELLPFYTDLAGRLLLPFYAKLWPVTFTSLYTIKILLRRTARATHAEHACGLGERA